MSEEKKAQKNSTAKAAKKVFIGMSGGVDSSVSAALLKEAGYDVTGVFIKVWQPDWINCTWREDRLDAMRVAAQLGIDFVTLDLEDTYKKEVIDYMIAEYRAGRTPNPDVMCNRHVKFGGFFDWAMEQGADYVATGHYARIIREDIAGSEAVFSLVAGDDSNKDQSYFLWTLGQRELSKTLFLVGDIEKPEVRRLARKFGLATAEKKDSQGLCFVGKIDIKEFLSHYIESKKGDVLDIDGRVIGSHEGSWMYTIGERHGFVISNKHKTATDAPYYVVSKDIERNTITVAHDLRKAKKEGEKTAHNLINIQQVNWTRGITPAEGSMFQARSRYREMLFQVRLVSYDAVRRTAKLSLDSAHQTLSPGQSLVIYDGHICLGGGILSA